MAFTLRFLKHTHFTASHTHNYHLTKALAHFYMKVYFIASCCWYAFIVYIMSYLRSIARKNGTHFYFPSYLIHQRCMKATNFCSLSIFVFFAFLCLVNDVLGVSSLNAINIKNFPYTFTKKSSFWLLVEYKRRFSRFWVFSFFPSNQSLCLCIKFNEKSFSGARTLML